MKRVLLPLPRFVGWLFGRRGQGIDLALAPPAIGWAALMLLKPELFDVGSFQGMAWLPDTAWIAVMAALGCGHVAGLALPGHVRPRVWLCFVAAWVWLSIAISLGRQGPGTGVILYAELGLMALFGGLHLSSLPRDR